jgi:hypothetical protein
MKFFSIGKFLLIIKRNLDEIKKKKNKFIKIFFIKKNKLINNLEKKKKIQK